MPDYGLHLLWPTPIIRVKNPDHARIKPALLRFAYESEKRAARPIESGVAPHLKNALYESTMDVFNTSPEPALRELSHFCMQCVGEMAAQLRAKLHPESPLEQIGVLIHESWVHITHDRGYHETHAHPNCSWCGIYTVEAGDCTYEPRNGTSRFDSPTEPNYYDLGTEAYNDGALYVCPEDGLLVLFPSTVRHSATPYNGTRDRIVIAFNARVYKP